MKALYLIAEIAGQRIAIEAERIDSVVHVGMITPVPLMPPHLIGLAALRSRVITMIDSRRALGLEAAEAGPVLTAVVVDVEGHRYGLTVDRVEDVCEIASAVSPTRGRVGEGWSGASRGMLDDGAASLLLIDPAALVAGPSRAEAA